MGRNNLFTRGNLLNYEYFSKYYKLFAIDVSEQIELENLDLKQKIIFIGRLERNVGATMFFIMEMSEETTLNLHKMLQEFLPSMRGPSDVSFRPHVGWVIAYHAKTSSRRRNWYVNETNLFETSLRHLTVT